MKKSLSVILFTTLLSIVAFAADGDLDLTFNTTGSRVTDIASNSNDVIFNIGLMPDGRIVGMGIGNGQTAAVRYMPNGTLDTSFSGDGIASAFPGTGTSGALQSDGKIVISGASAGSLLQVVRYNVDGTVDATFSGDGQATASTPVGNAGPNARATLIQADGKIVVVGTLSFQTGDFRDIFLARFETDGTLDPTFGTGGLSIIDLTPNGVEIAQEAVLTSDGKILIAGAKNDDGGVGFNNFLVARFNSDGSVDTSFDGDGWKTIAVVTDNNDSADSIAIAPGGKILVGGIYTNFTVSNGPVLLRLNPDGSLDTSFDGDGILFPIARPVALLVQPDGKFFTAGTVNTTVYRLSKFNSDGTPDTTFSSDGGTNGSGSATAIALQPDGKILVSGSQLASAGNNAFVTTRFLNTSFTPTAGEITVSGRVVTSDGRGLRNALVCLQLEDGSQLTSRTGSFGYFRFAGLDAGQTAVLTVVSKQLAFSPRVLSISDEISDLVISPDDAPTIPGARRPAK